MKHADPQRSEEEGVDGPPGAVRPSRTTDPVSAGGLPGRTSISPTNSVHSMPGRIRGMDYEGLSHPQRQALAHRFEAALRLLDEHCRVYQYLLKRTVGPFVAATCEQPIANEAIQRRAAYLNGGRQDLYDLSLYLVLLYEPPHVARRSSELRRLLAGTAPSLARVAFGGSHPSAPGI